MVPGDQLRDAVLSWWGSPGVRRDLPWRRTRDPWAVLVSEVMLQQTQVPRVIPVYGRFLDLFPTPAACAGAPIGDVVRAWAGLGYNRRAVNLHRTAVAVTEHHGGRVPADLAGLLQLPGIGAYTARAVLAFAFETDVAVLDTNVMRVLTRVTATAGQAQADGLVPPRRAWAWNSALLDLGATVCTASRPRCQACPLRDHCLWYAAGRPLPDPATTPKQSRFAGSDRQGRGRLVAALRSGPIRADQAVAAAGWPGRHERAARMVAALLTDGLAVKSSDGVWALPTLTTVASVSEVEDPLGPEGAESVTFDQAHFRSVLGHFATGVTVVAGVDDGQPLGLSVNSFTSVSLDPPLIAFCAAEGSSTWPRLRAVGTFTINVLAEHQEELSRVFATRGADKFRDVRWWPSPSGAPVIEGVLAWVDVRLQTEYEAGDHLLIVCRVTDLDVADEGRPLIFYRGGYGRFEP